MDQMEKLVAKHFEQAWAKPSPIVLGKILHQDVTLRQPDSPPIQGRQAAIHTFEKLLTFVPGLYGIVERSMGEDGVLFIEWKMIFPLGRKTIAVKAVDRIVVKDGLIYDRIAYFDKTKLVKAIMLTPSLWIKYVRYRKSTGN